MIATGVFRVDPNQRNLLQKMSGVLRLLVVLAAARALSTSPSSPRRPIAKRAFFKSFEEARDMARAMGMSSREEYEEYDCPGAYRLPKRPEETWPDAWLGWDDWLGVPLALADASAAARRLGLRAEDEYLAHVRAHPGDRLPARPDRYYRERWGGWESFLSGDAH